MPELEHALVAAEMGVAWGVGGGGGGGGGGDSGGSGAALAPTSLPCLSLKRPQELLLLQRYLHVSCQHWLHPAANIGPMGH